MHPGCEQMQQVKVEPCQAQKVIGMIGGASWESTVLYYRLINQEVGRLLGGLNSARLLIYSVNYEPIVALEGEGKWDEVGEQMARAAKILQEAGADFIILCCNTLHKATPFIEAAIEIPFLHIADAAGAMLSNNKIQKIGLLGTQFTMEDGFYAERLKTKFGLDVIIPSQSERKRMDEIIYLELCQGKVLPASKGEALSMIDRLKKAGAEAVLLACTELGMLIEEQDASIPVYDTVSLHAEEAIRLSLPQK